MRNESNGDKYDRAEKKKKSIEGLGKLATIFKILFTCELLSLNCSLEDSLGSSPIPLGFMHLTFSLLP